MLRKLQHENVLQCIGWCADTFALVLELCVDTLRSIIDGIKNIRLDQTSSFLAQIASGLGYIHGKQIIHRGEAQLCQQR
jgi:serine/threonine protein kinase